MTSKQKASLIRRIQTRLAKGRECYEKADIFFNKLLDGMTVGEVVELPEGPITLVDNFAKSNTAYRVARVPRYELKEVKLAKTAKKKDAEQQPELPPVEAAVA